MQQASYELTYTDFFFFFFFYHIGLLLSWLPSHSGEWLDLALINKGHEIYEF